jgi:hypothetical protein
MYPSRQQVKNRYLSHLDDPAGNIFGDPPGWPATNVIPSLFQESFGEAYDCLYQSYLFNQVPRITLIQFVTLAPGTTSITPTEMGINDFGDFEVLSERTFGSSDTFKDMTASDRLPQRLQGDRLIDFVWRNNTFYFVGSTQVIELQLQYDSSGEAPTDDATVIAVDSSLNFLANYAAGVAGGPKGYDDIAKRCMRFAVGPRYDEGVIGGDLYRLIQPLVRSRQAVQVAPKPYGSWRRRMGRRWAVPFVAAQQGTTGGGANNIPIQYSSTAGTIVGVIDGVNAVFWLSTGVQAITQVARNGQVLNQNADYTLLSNQVTFIGVQIPQPGDVITAEAYLA